MKKEFISMDDFEKGHLLSFLKVISNDLRNYKHKRTRELIITEIFVILVLIFQNPIIAFNINLLNTLGYSLYLPIFTISTVILPILVGKGVEYIFNHKNNCSEGIVNKIRDDFILAHYDTFQYENFKFKADDIENYKKITFPPKISNLTKNEILQEIDNIINAQVIKQNNDKLKDGTIFYLFLIMQLSILPITLYQPIFSTIGLNTLSNTFILKIIFLLMGISIGKIEANKYNEDLKNTINYLNEKFKKTSNFEKKDFDMLFKAYKSRVISEYLEIEEKLEEIKPKEETSNKENILDKKLTFTKIAPKVVDCEFKGNPEEKRNAKVLIKRK